MVDNRMERLDGTFDETNTRCWFVVFRASHTLR